MMHILISDTHAPLCLNNAKNYAAEIISKIPEVDAIVVNGDLLGVFAMKQSSLYKGRIIGKGEKLRHLKESAPKFYEKFTQTNNVSLEMVKEYVDERYQWCVDKLVELTDLRLTIFNLGNHESNQHFLVLQEIPFLTEQALPNLTSKDYDCFLDIFKDFEKKLYEMEQRYHFKYIRNKPFVLGKVMMLGIPGESHSTIGPDEEAINQEKKTEQLLINAGFSAGLIDTLIIYNHTQGNYDSSTGSFDTASPSLRKFMAELPKNIKTRIYVQSHNHWNYTQFSFRDGFHFIMNNAGLHNGIFNLIDFDSKKVDCYDADPINKKMVKLKVSTEFPVVTDKDQLIARNYPDPNYVLIRGRVSGVLDNLLGKS